MIYLCALAFLVNVGVSAGLGGANVVFLIDNGLSTTAKEFEDAKNFVLKTAADYGFGEYNDVNVGVVTYHDKIVADSIPLYSCKTMSELKNAVDQMKWNRGFMTYTGYALREVREKILPKDSKVPNIVILITDNSASDVTTAINESKIYKKDGITIVGVAVRYGKEFVERMTTNIVTVSNWNEIESVAKDTAERVKKIVVPPAPTPLACPEGFADVNGKCRIICKVGWEPVDKNKCRRICNPPYVNVNDICRLTCKYGWKPVDNKRCVRICSPPYVNVNDICRLTCKIGWKPVENKRCVRVCQDPYYNIDDNTCKRNTCKWYGKVFIFCSGSTYHCKKNGKTDCGWSNSGCWFGHKVLCCDRCEPK